MSQQCGYESTEMTAKFWWYKN